MKTKMLAMFFALFVSQLAMAEQIVTVKMTTTVEGPYCATFNQMIELQMYMKTYEEMYDAGSCRALPAGSVVDIIPNIERMHVMIMIKNGQKLSIPKYMFMEKNI